MISWVKSFIVAKSDSANQIYDQNVKPVIDYQEDKVPYTQNNAIPIMNSEVIPVIDHSSKDQSNVMLAEINSDVVNSGLALADFLTRQYSKVGSLSKDRLMEDRIAGIEKFVKKAVSCW